MTRTDERVPRSSPETEDLDDKSVPRRALRCVLWCVQGTLAETREVPGWRDIRPWMRHLWVEKKELYSLRSYCDSERPVSSLAGPDSRPASSGPCPDISSIIWFGCSREDRLLCWSLCEHFSPDWGSNLYPEMWKKTDFLLVFFGFVRMTGRFTAGQLMRCKNNFTHPILCGVQVTVMV